MTTNLMREIVYDDDDYRATLFVNVISGQNIPTDKSNGADSCNQQSNTSNVTQHNNRPRGSLCDRQGRGTTVHQ